MNGGPRKYSLVLPNGALLGHIICSDEHLEANLIEWRSRYGEGLVVQEGDADVRPPAPDEQHEWDSEAKAWKPSRAAIVKAELLRQVRIVELRKLRPLGELALDPNNVEARRHLESIENELVELRNGLRG